MNEIKVYCPLKLYYFPGCSEKEFAEMNDVDEQYVWDEVELKNGHNVWSGPLQGVIDRIADSMHAGLSFIDEPDHMRYNNIKNKISGNSLELTLHED